MRLTIEKLCYGADAIARTPEGKTVFVAGGVPGDVVEASVVQTGPSFDRAVVAQVLEPSPDRVLPPDPAAAALGTCPWACVSRPVQLAAKRQNLVDALARTGRLGAEAAEALVAPIRSAGPDWGYRNKVELTPFERGGKLAFGFHGRDPRQLVPAKTCPLFNRKHQKAVKGVAGALSFLANSRDLRLERVGIRASDRTGQLEVALWTPTGAFPRAQAARVLQDAAPGVTGIVRVMSKGPLGARRVSGIELLWGKSCWRERIAGGEMLLSAPSFFQVNTAAAEVLVDLVMEGLDPRPDETAMDLYCGAGTFTLPLAGACDYVAAVESYGPAVRDLRRNLERRGADNVEAVGGDAGREFPDDADLIVVDPPRAGLAADVVDQVTRSSARAVAYVSCDPATLARDLARFAEAGELRPVAVTPVDLFPQTFHCEAVAVLTRAAKCPEGSPRTAPRRPERP